MTTITDQLLKHKFLPMLVAGTVCFGKRVVERVGEQRSLRVYLHGESATLELVERNNNGIVAQIKATTVSVSTLTDCIAGFVVSDS